MFEILGEPLWDNPFAQRFVVCADLQEEMQLIIWCQSNMLCCSRSSCLKLMEHSQHVSKMQCIGSVLGALSLLETQHAESIGSVLGVFRSYCWLGSNREGCEKWFFLHKWLIFHEWWTWPLCHTFERHGETHRFARGYGPLYSMRRAILCLHIRNITALDTLLCARVSLEVHGSVSMLPRCSIIDVFL